MASKVPEALPFKGRGNLPRARILALRIAALLGMALVVCLVAQALWTPDGSAESFDGVSSTVTVIREPVSVSSVLSGLLFAAVPMLILWRLYLLRRWAGGLLISVSGLSLLCLLLFLTVWSKQAAYSPNVAIATLFPAVATTPLAGLALFAWRDLKSGY